jgi:hypothetical protein
VAVSRGVVQHAVAVAVVRRQQRAPTLLQQAEKNIRLGPYLRAISHSPEGGITVGGVGSYPEEADVPRGTGWSARSRPQRRAAAGSRLSQQPVKKWHQSYLLIDHWIPCQRQLRIYVTEV